MTPKYYNNVVLLFTSTPLNSPNVTLEFSWLLSNLGDLAQLLETPATEPTLLIDRVITESLLYSTLMRHPQVGNDMIRCKYYHDTFNSTTLLYPSPFLSGQDNVAKATLKDQGITYTNLICVYSHPQVPIGHSIEHSQQRRIDEELIQVNNPKTIHFTIGTNLLVSQSDPYVLQKQQGVSRRLGYIIVASQIFREYDGRVTNVHDNLEQHLNVFSPYLSQVKEP